MAKQVGSTAKRRNGLRHARLLITDVCEVAGSPSLIEDAGDELAQAGVIDAIQRHDNATIFNWLMDAVSYQGVSNAAAYGYIQAHGNARYSRLAASLQRPPSCPRLTSWWHFEQCGFRKNKFTCNEPSRIRRCPLPALPLRNGSLNQSAYALFLFMRDVCRGDFVHWIDERLSCIGQPEPESIIGPLRDVPGVSDKVLAMTLSMMLLAGDPNRTLWIAAGAKMVAVDTLVHAWLSRTGILRRLDAEHVYGTNCYAAGGCAAIITQAANAIDAARFNRGFPSVFPRFVQHAIWRFCAQPGLGQCNGITVPDGTTCNDGTCELFVLCDRIEQPRIDPAAF